MTAQELKSVSLALFCFLHIHYDMVSEPPRQMDFPSQQYCDFNNLLDEAHKHLCGSFKK